MFNKIKYFIKPRGIVAKVEGIKSPKNVNVLLSF